MRIGKGWCAVPVVCDNCQEWLFDVEGHNFTSNVQHRGWVMISTVSSLHPDTHTHSYFFLFVFFLSMLCCTGVGGVGVGVFVCYLEDEEGVGGGFFHYLAL